MSGIFAPAEIFAAVAGYSDGSEGLAEGTHLRLLPSPAIGFPLAPFAVWQVRLLSMEFDVVWTDRRGTPVSEPDLDQHDGELHGYVRTFGDWRMAAIELNPTNFEPFEFALLDGISPTGSRVVVERSSEPWLLAAPRIDHLRIRGRGRVDDVRAYGQIDDRLLGLVLGSQPQPLGLPVEGEFPWYRGGEGPEVAFERVKRGAPPLLGPPDLPDGSSASVEASEEVDRIAVLAGEIERQLQSMLGDPETPPWLYRHPGETRGQTPQQRTSFEAASGLLLQGLDPGLGRFLGLMTTEDHPFEGPTDAWAAAGVFALDPERSLPDGRRVGEAFTGPGAQLEPLLNQLIATFDLGEVVEEQRSRGLLVEPLLTIAAAPPLPNRPAPPALSPGASRWLVDERPFSASFRQQLLVQDTPLAPLVALARQDEGEWRSLHQMLELPSGALRAKALLLGHDASGVGILADAPVPDREEPLLYRVHLGDLFGRYGKENEVEVSPPPHLPPPRPTPQTEIVRSEPAGDGPQSPGSLIVRVPIPQPGEIPPGGRAPAEVSAELDGESESTAAEGSLAEFAFALPELMPGGEELLSLTVGFRDDRGVESDPAREAVRVADARAPKPLRTAAGLVWTSRPGPSEEVELRLAWPGRAGERYRVYFADAGSLGVTTAGRTRAEIAEDVGDLGTIDRRERFRLLTDPPLEADEAGRVLLESHLPRSLQTVGVIRVVPVSAGNVEAPFANCGLVAVAVPAERRPPPPRLAVAVDAGDGRASISIEAPGLNREELQRAEGGLFTNPPSTEARPPEFRLRRAVGELVDPVYARRRTQGELQREQRNGEDLFAAEFEDGDAGEGLEPYIRYVYWAEVRMPPERRLPPGVPQVPMPGGIAATEPAQMADAPGVFSRPSAHAYAMRVPAQVPRLLADQVEATVLPGDEAAATVRLGITLSDGPSTHNSAIDCYRLRVWWRRPGSPITLLTTGETMPCVQGELEWSSEPFPQPQAGEPVEVLLAYVDPLGRQGPILELAAPASP